MTGGVSYVAEISGAGFTSAGFAKRCPRMAETTLPNPADAGIEVRTYFVRGRNALLARVDFGELFVDYYLHLSANRIKVAPEHDALFKRALAAFTLHCASRPW